ncbi:endonuclease [Luteimonas sp. RD2P54]|uniref:Endonuclease n=1 Tax=Luteimonas endophytica TaxID=3042023 RepID=A0ABT6J6Y1_9GAMM|nr:endonuclease [Luteimonas endophytica]MDH5822587.1 endonuclease [Luteimonas endophytica]
MRNPRTRHRSPLRGPLPALSLGMALLLPGLPLSAAVFVNELHYDNAGADRGEAVEVVSTAGEDLGGYRLHLYNGGSTPGSARSYGSHAVPDGQAASCGGSVRVATVAFPANGLQNGAADGMALVDGQGRVVQFLSYEGTITAADGPAAGTTSDNLPLAEGSATAAGTSLQLHGDGVGAPGFAWTGGVPASFGACNDGQTFGGGSGNAAPQVVATTPADGAADFPAAGDLAIEFSEPVALAAGALVLECSVSGPVALDHAASGDVLAISTGTALHGGEACTLTMLAAAVADQDGSHPESDLQVGFTVAGGGGDSGDYYGRVNPSSPEQLRCSLHHTLRGHTVYPYSGGGTDAWAILEIADEDPADPGRVRDVYRNRSYAKGDARAGTGSGATYNREHTWPNSLGFGSRTGDRGLPNAPYTDAHMLYLSDTGYNAARGNRPFADCPASANCGERVTEANGGVGGGSGAYPGNSNWVRSPDGNGGAFEVWGHRKGDIARAVMYMAIRYEGGADPATGQSEPDLELTDDRSRIVVTSSSPAYMGLLSTLLAWHAADPPDSAERERNQVVYSFQGNRNPFIDHPQWATAALFESSAPATCQLLD